MKSLLRDTGFVTLDRLNRVVCRIMYGVLRPSVECLPKSGPVLLVSNHSSYSDPLVLMAATCRPIRFLMAREIYERPLISWVFRVFRSIPVSRGRQDVAAIRAMLRALREGEVLGIFPEGGIDQFRNEAGWQGMGYVALKTGVPVVPVAVQWANPRPKGMIRAFLVPGRVSIQFGPVIPGKRVARPNREDIQAAHEIIMNELIRLLQTNPFAQEGRARKRVVG